MITNYNTLHDLLTAHRIPKGNPNKLPVTNTRIAHKETNIWGGSYSIPDDIMPQLFNLYYKHVFIDKKKEYLTEYQQDDESPICIDLDLKYPAEVTTRQHNDEHIGDFIDLYLEKLKEMVIFEENVSIPIYVFQKPNVVADINKTKDGIHIIIGINFKRSLHRILRNRVLSEISKVWSDIDDIKTNSWTDVIDDHFINNSTPWQMFGSRKPLSTEAYQLTNITNISWNSTDKEFIQNSIRIKDFNIQDNLYKLSVRWKGYPTFNMTDSIKDEFDEIETQRVKEKDRKKTKKINIKINTNENIPYSAINSPEILDKAIQILHNNIKERPEDYKIKEIHEYAMALPDTYYDKGSYDKWLRLGWALRNTNKELILTWLAVSSKSSEWDWNIGPQDCFDRWMNMQRNTHDGLTHKSIMYWAKNENPEQYQKIKESNVDHYVEESIKLPAEYNLALVLYHYYKDDFVCVDITHKIWYEYRGHKWHEIDQGHRLRQGLSETIYKLYTEKVSAITNELPDIDDGTQNYTDKSERASRISEIASLFRKTPIKSNIMKEALDLFYMEDFIELLDSKNHLLCFDNGVIDFDEKIFRPGRPEDYNSKSTKIKYKPINPTKDSIIINEINMFMEQLFPKEELRKYMWEHLASVLIGKNENHTFNIYTGGGSNGKSKIVELMTLLLGDYKGTVPLTLITQKRNTIGGTSSEVAQLQGIRYAVMQEASKGDVINEGILKELTGGDPIQARALYKDSVTFYPQFKLVCTLNNLPDIKSTDNGTWRRIRVCDFESLFCENPVTDNPDKPNQFKIDKKLDLKLINWANVFMSMLVDIAYEKNGIVEDVPIVMEASNRYRNEQDHISQFIHEMVEVDPNGKIQKKELQEEFSQWYKETHGGKQMPSVADLHKQMDKKFERVRATWKGVKLLYEEEDDTPNINDH